MRGAGCEGEHSAHVGILKGTGKKRRVYMQLFTLLEDGPVFSRKLVLYPIKPGMSTFLLVIFREAVRSSLCLISLANV